GDRVRAGGGGGRGLGASGALRRGGAAGRRDGRDDSPQRLRRVRHPGRTLNQQRAGRLGHLLRDLALGREHLAREFLRAGHELAAARQPAQHVLGQLRGGQLGGRQLRQVGGLHLEGGQLGGRQLRPVGGLHRDGGQLW